MFRKNKQRGLGWGEHQDCLENLTMSANIPSKTQDLQSRSKRFYSFNKSKNVKRVE
jgi:hypothetical protein